VGAGVYLKHYWQHWDQRTNWADREREPAGDRESEKKENDTFTATASIEEADSCQ